jgi:hypothetical protein
MEQSRWKLVVDQLLKKISVFYGTWNFITVFITDSPFSEPDESIRIIAPYFSTF